MSPCKSYVCLARPLVSSPTAPFHEDFPLAVVERFAAERPKLKYSRDRHGNVLLLYNGPRSSRQARLILTAHLDHPGLLFQEAIDERTLKFGLYGGVLPTLLNGANIRLYCTSRGATQRPARGTIIETETGPQKRTTVTVLLPRPLQWIPTHPGTFGIWDLPAWRLRGQRLHALACDDLAGAAVGLAFLDSLLQRNAPTSAGLLLTRAEEVGFVGMLAALEESYLDPDALYVNIECSSIKAGAAMGGGPVVRVGDRMSIFDPQISAALAASAQNLQTANSDLLFQRRLMDSGSCEATPLVQRGFRTGAVALPLGNYHNIGDRTLGAECIDLRDACNLVDLLVYIASEKGGLLGAQQQASQALDSGLAGRLKSYQRLLEATSAV